MDDNERKELQEKELELLNNWKTTGDKSYFQQLYRSYKPLLNKAAQKASRGSNLPSSVFELESAQQFHDSLKRFNPSLGVKLSTFVHGNVEDKNKRLNYLYQDLGRIPERGGKSLGIYHVGVLNNTKEMLYQQYGREPTALEIGKEMGVSAMKVESLMQETKKDLSLNSTVEDAATSDDFAGDLAILNMHYYDMNPEQQTLYNYVSDKTGTGEMLKPSGTVDWNKIAAKMGIPLQRVNKIRKQIKQMVESAKKGY